MGRMFRNVYAVGLDESSPRIDKSASDFLSRCDGVDS